MSDYVQKRIQIINSYNERYGDTFDPAPANLVALGAALRILGEGQWQLVENTVKDFLPELYPER